MKKQKCLWKKVANNDEEGYRLLEQGKSAYPTLRKNLPCFTCDGYYRPDCKEFVADD